MRIEIPRLDPAGESFAGRLDPAVLDLDAEASLMSVTEGIAYEVFAQIVSEALLVRGRLHVELDAECARCGTRFRLAAREDDFCEMIPLDIGVVEVNLTPAMREAILLALPAHPVCDPGCAGLCPRCGQRRSETDRPCDCPHGADARWSLLDTLENGGSNRAD